MDSIVVLDHVTKTFKNKKAVDQVSFSIKKGEVVAILGPNGAGKTTSIMMMLGLLDPTSGEVRVFNSHPKEKKIRERIGAMLQEVSVIDALKVKEIIQLFRSYYPNPMPFEELVAFTGLNKDDLKRRADKLSGGQKRRLGFALALAGDPELVFFDEPTVGLDITSRKLFWNTIGELKARGKTIIFTTHYLQEADDVADRIILFNHGTIIEDGTPAEIKAKLSKQSVSFAASEAIDIADLKRLPHVSDVYKRNDRIYVITDQTDAVIAALFEKKIKISGIQIEHGRLDEAFEQLTENKEAI
ncbi:ABC transporter ATP-binding protein [Cytobacillus solani]|uniref:ABC transporter ATP-binding protein n=1 Tax=Cytobacillus solani TaxID=1637975 RepID=UPI0006ABE266|nr:ABC transporter ATP-binding protein [Cytobacillus solani]KOP83420.1 ABC transporter ATP-binding protein [Bacillus sp. FJAT-21945]USK53709.1 ABC transporter ATP-binding protein [Cytobacillus solani]